MARTTRLSAPQHDTVNGHYYNDNDRSAVRWLRQLIDDGHLPEGHVDDRDITEITPADLTGYTSHHFFAGIGGWAHALDLADWSRNRPVWTASLPCQPFSDAGDKQGDADDRHLWPTFRRLVAVVLPETIMGEQVASRMGRDWMGNVRFDLEHIVYWRAWNQTLRQVQVAETFDRVSEILGEVFGRIETAASTTRVKQTVPQVEPTTSTAPEPTGLQSLIHRSGLSETPGQPAGVSPDTNHGDGWAAAEQHPWTQKRGQCADAQNRTARWVSVLEHQRGLFTDEYGTGELGGDGVQQDCRRIFGEEHLNEQRIFTEGLRVLIAASHRRLVLAGVRVDLEPLGYACGASDLPAAGVGAPHVRQRLWWVAHTDRTRREDSSQGQEPVLGGGGTSSSRVPANNRRPRRHRTDDADVGVVDTDSEHSEGGTGSRQQNQTQSGMPGLERPVGGWDTYDWIACADGKTRRIEPGLSPLADGIPNRVVQLRGYGNSIVPQVAAVFIAAADEAIKDTGRTNGMNADIALTEPDTADHAVTQ